MALTASAGSLEVEEMSFLMKSSSEVCGGWNGRRGKVGSHEAGAGLASMGSAGRGEVRTQA